MDVFHLRQRVIEDHGRYVRSFLTIRDERIHRLVREEMDGGLLWPDPLIQLNPAFEPGDTLAALIRAGELHPECLQIFRDKREDGTVGAPFRLHRHQVEGIRAARAGDLPALHGPGERRGSQADHRLAARHPAHQLRDAGAGAHPPLGPPTH